MIARVTLEIALRKEFDYLIPGELARQVEVGTRVQVPFGPRQVFGCVTALVEESPVTNLPNFKGRGRALTGDAKGSAVGPLDSRLLLLSR